MKILIVGSDKVWAIENIYKKELAKNANVELYNAHGVFHDFYHASIFNKLSYRLGASSILKKINQDLLNVAQDFQPDVVWVFKGMEIFPKTLKQIKEKGIVLANYNPDHPFRFESRGSGNRNVSNSIQLYDHHFSYSIQIQKELENKYRISSTWLPFGFLRCQKNTNTKLIKRICFIGNPDSERFRIISLLSSHKLPLTVFGNDWNKYIRRNDKNIEIKDVIYDDDFVHEAQRFAVQLNIFRKQNSGSHNMRTFEMPALGCVMLAPDSSEHHKLFEEGQEAFFYQNDEDLIEKSKQLLSLGDEEIKNIQEKAYQRSVNSAYCYTNRAEQVYKTFEQLLNRKL